MTLEQQIQSNKLLAVTREIERLEEQMKALQAVEAKEALTFAAMVFPEQGAQVIRELLCRLKGREAMRRVNEFFREKTGYYLKADCEDCRYYYDCNQLQCGGFEPVE